MTAVVPGRARRLVLSALIVVLLVTPFAAPRRANAQVGSVVAGAAGVACTFIMPGVGTVGCATGTLGAIALGTMAAYGTYYVATETEMGESITAFWASAPGWMLDHALAVFGAGDSVVTWEDAAGYDESEFLATMAAAQLLGGEAEFHGPGYFVSESGVPVFGALGGGAIWAPAVALGSDEEYAEFWGVGAVPAEAPKADGSGTFVPAYVQIRAIDWVRDRDDPTHAASQLRLERVGEGDHLALPLGAGDHVGDRYLHTGIDSTSVAVGPGDVVRLYMENSGSAGTYQGYLPDIAWRFASASLTVSSWTVVRAATWDDLPVLAAPHVGIQNVPSSDDGRHIQIPGPPYLGNWIGQEVGPETVIEGVGGAVGDLVTGATDGILDGLMDPVVEWLQNIWGAVDRMRGEVLDIPDLIAALPGQIGLALEGLFVPSEGVQLRLDGQYQRWKGLPPFVFVAAVAGAVSSFAALTLVEAGPVCIPLGEEETAFEADLCLPPEGFAPGFLSGLRTASVAVSLVSVPLYLVGWYRRFLAAE